MTIKTLNEYAIQFVGLPYLWGGDDPILGFDCSGFAQEIMAAAGVDPPGDQTAQMLYNYLSENGLYNVRRGGSFAFYGKGPQKITHVAYLFDKFTIIEFGGGGSRTKSEEDAARHNAYCRLRPLERRSDLVAVMRPKYPFETYVGV